MKISIANSFVDRVMCRWSQKFLIVLLGKDRSNFCQQSLLGYLVKLDRVQQQVLYRLFQE